MAQDCLDLVLISDDHLLTAGQVSLNYDKCSQRQPNTLAYCCGIKAPVFLSHTLAQAYYLMEEHILDTNAGKQLPQISSQL